VIINNSYTMEISSLLSKDTLPSFICFSSSFTKWIGWSKIQRLEHLNNVVDTFLSWRERCFQCVQ